MEKDVKRYRIGRITIRKRYRVGHITQKHMSSGGKDGGQGKG